jgi:7,8-dihydropterin-6-yl-methyl-4-(beta-D-ribofuranosyl)aminobenzene 5'-phosphate synthase
MAKSANGIAVVTGCSHPGIITILTKVKTIFPAEKIALILGGFHLRDSACEAIEEIASQLVTVGVQKVSPAHCTGEPAQAIFKRRFGANYVPASAGNQIEI